MANDDKQINVSINAQSLFSKFKKLIPWIVIIILSIIICRSYIYDGINTHKVDNTIQEIKNELANKEKEINELKEKSKQQQIIIKETVKNEIKTMPPDDVANGIINELKLFGN